VVWEERFEVSLRVINIVPKGDAVVRPCQRGPHTHKIGSNKQYKKGFTVYRSKKKGCAVGPRHAFFPPWCMQMMFNFGQWIYHIFGCNLQVAKIDLGEISPRVYILNFASLVGKNQTDVYLQV
jgi:hypothetical protein